MFVAKTVKDMRGFIAGKGNSGSVALVPTMGALHEGHLSLVKCAHEVADTVVMSIFVNPSQFGVGEDFEAYPRPVERDLTLAEAAGVDCVFLPSAAEMYPEGFSSFVEIENIGNYLCGAARPGHFRGVATVVIKLFNIVEPDYAVFGQKDGQQVAIIEQMAEDFNLRVKIIRASIVREPDGLALSSRNIYLSIEERRQAIILSEGIFLGKKLFDGGERDAESIKAAVIAHIKKAPSAAIEYVEIVDARRLCPVKDFQNRAMLAVAVRFGTTRLIDNVIF